MEVISQGLSDLQLSKSKKASVVELEPGTDAVTSDAVDQQLTSYLLPVHKEYLEKLKQDDTKESDGFQISSKLMENLFHYIWGPDLFKASRRQLKRIYEDVSAKLKVSPDQSDLEDMLEYHPTEVVSSKFIQLVVSMILVEPGAVEEDFNYLGNLLKDERISRESSALEAYEFLLYSLKQLFMVLTGHKATTKLTEQAPKEFNDLNNESKGIIKGLSALYMKAFRAKPQERLVRMQNAVTSVPGSVGWILYAAEMLRLKRREARTMSKRPTAQELDLVEQALKMEGNNPFVRLTVIDCVIDSVRETNGRFHCGDVHLYDTDQAMKYLQDQCRKLCEDFPRNVYFLSIVSDYFARYVPYLYFDKELSGKLLLDAYSLNPNNPKTTHRLGIFYRMNMKNGEESLKWLEKTLNLDPSHFNANMDYYKSLLGKPDTCRDVGEKMEEQFKSTHASCWRDLERTEFQFYIGLAHFAEGKKDDTLKHWMEVMKSSELHFPLHNVDSDCSIYRWNSNFISTDKIREWIQDEWQKIKKEAHDSNPEGADRKKSIERIFYLMLGVVVPKRLDIMSGPYQSY